MTSRRLLFTRTGERSIPALLGAGNSSTAVLVALLLLWAFCFSSAALAQAGSLVVSNNPCALPGPDGPDRCRVNYQIVKPAGAFAACLWAADGSVLLDCQGHVSWSGVYVWTTQTPAAWVVKSHTHWPALSDFNSGVTFGSASVRATLPPDTFVMASNTCTLPGPIASNRCSINYSWTKPAHPTWFCLWARDPNGTTNLQDCQGHSNHSSTFTWVVAQPSTLFLKAHNELPGSNDFNLGALVATRTVQATASTPTVSVNLTAPANGTSLSAPATFTLSASASVSSGTINRVEFYRGASLVGTDTTAPYSVQDNGLSAGNYSYSARAFDNAAPVNSATSAAVAVTVTGFAADIYEVDDTPTLQTPPLNGSEPPQQRNFHVASDNDWALYWLGAHLRSTVTLQPVTASASNRWRAELYYTEAGDANYTRTLVMTRDFGITGTTLVGDSLPAAGRAFWVRVRPVDSTFVGAATAYRMSVSGEALPSTLSVSLTAPANNSTYSAPATINLSASASITGSTINRVEFYRGTTLVCSDTSSPYSCTDSNVPTGSYAYTAKASDNASPPNSVTSAPINLTVAGFAADSYEVDDTPTLQTPPLSGNEPPQQRNFHIAGDNDWALYWLGANLRSTVSLQPASPSSTNRWRAELYYTEAGDANYARTLVMTRDFGITGTTLVGDSLPTAGRAFWARVRPVDSTFVGAATAYTMSVSGEALPSTLSVSLTAPANNSTYAAPATIALSATATTAMGSINRVEFYRGTTLVCSDTSIPFACTDSNVPAGSYAYTAKAFDNAAPAGSVTSAPVNVTVTGASAGTPLPPALTPAAPLLPSASEILASSRVGTLDGALRVSESGAVNFSVDFLTAPGKGGLVPDLGLAYTGDGNLGVAGIGFNITGLSGVSRCRKTQEAGDGPGPHPQVNFDSNVGNDAFCLDGQRLLVAGSGTQSLDGVSYPYTEYRTELESFQRIRGFSSPAGATGTQLVYGPLFWRVEGKDGSIREFGRDYPDLLTQSATFANTGVLSTNDPATGLKIPARLITDGRMHVLSWSISAQSDRLGNRIRFRYGTGYTGSGLDPYISHYLSRVFYTGFTGAPASFEHAALAFDYAPIAAAKVQRGWVAGSYSVRDVELQTVRSCLRSNPGVAITADELSSTGSSLCNTAATTLRVYALGYSVQADQNEVVTSNPLTLTAGKYGSGRRRLSTLTTCADTARSICWPATTINWSSARAGLDFHNSTMSGVNFQRASGIRFSDITGDGKPDIIWREELTDNQPDKLRMNRAISNPASGNGISFGPTMDITKVPDALDNNLYGNDPDRNWGLLDVNGDGVDDLINTESVANNGGNNSGPWGWFVRLGTGTDAGFAAARTQLEGTSAFSGAAIVAQFQFTDTDGDGTVDMLSPKEVAGRTILQVAKGVRQDDGRLVFASPVEVQLDFGSGLSGCYRIGFGRKHRADRWDSYDFNGDALADLTLRVQNACASLDTGGREKPKPPYENYQFGLEPEPVLRINKEEENGPNNPAANVVEWAVFAAQSLATFKVLLIPTGVADTEGALRPTDLNGDGLLDLVKQTGQYGEWKYQLNNGNGVFGTEYCLVVNERWVTIGGGSPTPSQTSCFATRLPNTSNQLISDGQILLQDFDGDGFTDVWHSEDDPINQQSNSGKRFRVYRWKGAAANGSFNCTGFTFHCSDFEHRIYVAEGSTGQNLLRVPTGIWTNAIGGGSEAWRHLIADIDNDGYGDSFAYKKDANVASAGYMLIRSTDHHAPRDVLSSITSGYGATTSFVYSPMSYSSVYTRDYNGNELRTWGRGSSVADIVAPSYLVSSMSTPAPMAGNPANLAWMHYRYQGLKAQTGGRGSLGFRKIYTLNAQNGVETATEYHQMFPLNGRPLQTESRALNATGLANWRLNCNPDAAASASNACFYPTPQCKGGTCPHFSGEDANAMLRGQILARNTDTSVWRSRTPGNAAFGPQNAPLVAGVPASVFPVTLESLSERFESSGALENLVIATTRNRFYSTPGVSGYDNFGNLLSSTVENYSGSVSATAEKTVTTSSAYDNNETSWQLGLMRSTSVTHARPGRDPLTRTTEFAYNANGQLRMERVQPGSSEFQFTKYTEWHRFGVPSKIYSCSKAVEDAGRCGLDYVLGNTPVAGVEARLWVYRYAQTDYDEVSGLATVGYALRNNGGSPQLVIASQTSYDKWGNPRLVTPTDGAAITTTFDEFGRAVHQYTATGAQTTTLLARCEGAVRCPANAVTRSYSFTAGGPKQWAYADALGRGIANLSQIFKQGEYSLRYAEFDGLGRQIRQTEPSMTTQGPDQANSFPSSASLPSTESCYDVGGRVTYVKLPNHIGGFSCANPPSAAQITNPAPDGINVSQTIYRGLLTETINGLGQGQKTTVNSLGETVRSEDANAFVTDFAFDAIGNLSSVTRGAGTPEQSVSSMQYDIMGRRSQINDPSTGVRRSFHTPAGEAVREIDAKGQCLQHTLDFNGRVIQTAEYASASGTVCTGAVIKLTTHTFDRDRLGALASSSYGQSSNPSEAGSVRIDQRYDSYSRPVSTQRCIAAVTLNRTDALNCKVEQQGYDQYSRPYWSTDASSENLLHGENPYAASGAIHRGMRQYYSEEGTVISSGVAIHAGFAYKTTHLDGSTVYYETLTSNARGQVTQERVDGKTQFTTTRGYEASTGRLLTMNTGSLQNQSVSYDELGNLRSRTDQSVGRNLVESFSEYDALNRVKKAELRSGGALQGELLMSYSADGNITAKTGTGAYSASHIGSYSYGNSVAIGGGSCAAGSVHAVRAISDTGYCYDANGNQTQSLRRSDLAPQRIIAYSLFDKPGQIDSYEVGGSGHSTRYGYGPVREMAYRVDVPQYAGPLSSASVEVQYFGSVERELRKTGVPGQTKETYKRLIAGVMQIVEERTVNESTATAIGATLTLKTEVILKDHLGSTFLIVNSDGSDSQYQRFDVWGMRADAGTGSTQTLSQSYGSNNPNDPSKARTRKGFTGHEMVDGAGIVHMQGRIYDPRLGRFLQADPIVQDPLNAQNYNRYTYVYNNPLSLTDPSGYRSISANLELYWKPIVAIVIIVVTGGQAAAALAPGGAGATTALAWSVAGGAGAGLVTTGTLKGTVMGAVDGLLTFGIGQTFKGSWKALVIAHSLKGGMLEAMNGGDFGHGLVSAGLSKLSGIGIAKLDVGPVTEIILQSMAGGTISAATGGKFANGAVSAALQFAFNQALGRLSNPYQKPAHCVPHKDAAMATSVPPLNPNAYLSVLDIGNMTFISGEIEVGKVGMFDDKIRDKVVSESNSVFGNSVTEENGRTYITRINFTAVGKGQGDVLVGRMKMSQWEAFRNNCNIASAWTPRGGNQILFAPSSLTELHQAITGNKTGAHEMGHFFGLSHLPKETGALMSYGVGPYSSAYGRSFTGQEASTLASRHRLGASE